MSRVQFYNFGNEETYHFFRWVSESGQVDPLELIDRAIREAGPDEELDKGAGVSSEVKDSLAEILSELLWEQAPDLDPDLGEYEIGTVQDGPDWLLNPILSNALTRIDCQAVAVALLIQAGRWAPMNEPHEISLTS